MLSVQQGGIAGQGQHPGALAQQGRGTGTTCFLLGALSALSSQTELVGKPRPAWLLFSVGFTSQLSVHCTTAQQSQACPNSELHPSGVKMFGVGNVLCKAEINVLQEEVGDCS